MTPYSIGVKHTFLLCSISPHWGAGKPSSSAFPLSSVGGSHYFLFPLLTLIVTLTEGAYGISVEKIMSLSTVRSNNFIRIIH